jgi:hypothetical protein
MQLSLRRGETRRAEQGRRRQADQACRCHEAFPPIEVSWLQSPACFPRVQAGGSSVARD